MLTFVFLAIGIMLVVAMVIGYSVRKKPEGKDPLGSGVSDKLRREMEFHHAEKPQQ